MPLCHVTRTMVTTHNKTQHETCFYDEVGKRSQCAHAFCRDQHIDPSCEKYNPGIAGSLFMRFYNIPLPSSRIHNMVSKHIAKCARVQICILKILVSSRQNFNKSEKKLHVVYFCPSYCKKIVLITRYSLILCIFTSSTVDELKATCHYGNKYEIQCPSLHTIAMGV